jgi:predicted aspartyl protease
MHAIVRRVLVAVAVVAGSPLACAQAAQVVPTLYEAGHFYAVPETAGGQKLRLLVDTGGGGGSGMYWITAEAARRLGLTTRDCKRGDTTLAVASVPGFKTGRGLPPPVNSPCGKTLMIHPDPYPDGDGQLGAGYLPGRVWTFNYPAQRLMVQAPSWQPQASTHSTKLGLANGFARITIRVEGEPIQMLLDTGATAHLTAAGERASHMPAVGGYGVTSYIDSKVFDHWHQAHPDWRVVLEGDDLYGVGHATSLIEVPRVVVAGWSVGPVWFTEQSGVGVYMSRFTDQPIDGALGGNVFRHFVMTVDYPRRTAYFQCATGCEPAASKPSSNGRGR